jgi:hypothetical protein
MAVSMQLVWCAPCNKTILGSLVLVLVVCRILTILAADMRCAGTQVCPLLGVTCLSHATPAVQLQQQLSLADETRNQDVTCALPGSNQHYGIAVPR